MSVPGWAASLEARRQCLSYLPLDGDDEEPPYAVVEAFEPPHPLSVGPDLCDRIADACRRARPSTRLNGEHRTPVLEPQDEDAILDRVRQANDFWWRLDVVSWNLFCKFYRPGDQLIAHQDLHAAGARRKVAAGLQISDAEAYEGGDFVVSFNSERYHMPRTRGTLVVFPSWTVHEVEEVTAGERLSVIIHGWGPPLR